MANARPWPDAPLIRRWDDADEWCPWHEMLASQGDTCSADRPNQEVVPVMVTTFIVDCREQP